MAFQFSFRPRLLDRCTRLDNPCHAITSCCCSSSSNSAPIVPGRISPEKNQRAVVRAPYAGVLKKIKCKVGDIVGEGVELAEVEKAS